MHANRTTKYNAENFNAFVSGNLPLLAEVGIYIKYNKNIILKPNFKKLKVHKHMETGVAVLKLFPGISANFVQSFLSIPSLKAIVLESFGSGNAPSESWFLDPLYAAISKGVIILNVTQCMTGAVKHGKYETSIKLNDIGIISGRDITTEAALTKLMYLFGEGHGRNEIVKLLQMSLRGEVTIK